MERASCSCGQLGVEVDGPPVRVSVCHCYACQRRTGSVFGAQARWPREQVRFVGDASEWSRISDEGNRGTFRFCPTCGSTVWWTNEAIPDMVMIALGAFGEHATIVGAPRVSVYEERQHPWVTIGGDVEHLA